VNLIADSPRGEAEPDALGRAPLAASFGRRILALDCSQGLVVGVLGPWGSGKTTFLNYARPELRKGRKRWVVDTPTFKGSG
jgi:predicted KAP-like P-loop ATPase